MTTAVQRRRGTTGQHTVFTGLEGEVTIDTTKDTAVIHDGATAGGHPLAREDLTNAQVSTLGVITGSNTADDDQFVVFDTSAGALKKISRAELNNAIEQDPLASVDITGGTINGVQIGNTTAATIANVDNLRLDGNALTSTNTDGNIAITPNGTGEVDISKVDIDSGTIDGTVIGGATAAAGSFTTVTASGVITGNDLTASQAVFTNASKALVSNAITGSGNVVMSTSPTLVTPVLGTPSSGTVTNLTGTASININGTVGATTPATGSFTTLAASSPASFAAGTAALPSITRTGDTNTGMFFPAADTIAFSEGGVEAMRITNAGNVGIGTSSPGTYRLNAARNSTGDGGQIAITSAGGAGFVANPLNLDLDFLGFSDGVKARIRSIDQTANVNESILSFSVRSAANTLAERLRIDSAGNVGIGTSAPIASLDIQNPTSVNQLRLQTNKTDATNKTSAIITGHHTNFEEGLLTVGGFSTATEGVVYVGGGYNAANAATSLEFYTAANNTTTVGSERMRIDSAGALILAGSTAQKATGTTWSNPSDERLKDNIRDYGKGIAELMQVRVREWEYNGKGGTVDGTKGMGVVADEVMVVLPDTVENYEAKLNADDEEVTAIKKFDATEITWLLVKTVQEQQALITTLTARVAALESN